PASDLRHDLDAHVLVLQYGHPVRLRRLLVLDLVDDRMRIDAARAALVYPLVQEHRVALRLPDAVRRDRYVFFPYACGVVMMALLHGNPSLVGSPLYCTSAAPSFQLTKRGS